MHHMLFTQMGENKLEGRHCNDTWHSSCYQKKKALFCQRSRMKHRSEHYYRSMHRVHILEFDDVINQLKDTY